MKIDIVTIFPDMFPKFLGHGIVRRAVEKEQLSVELVDLRLFTTDRHRTVDDRPFGGGEGMVMKPEPIFRAVRKVRETGDPSLVILLSPQGKRLNQSMAERLSLEPRLTLICGRYEGVDQRVADGLADEEISVGDFILSGGEVAAMLVVDAVSRLLPGVVGNPSSVLEESFMHGALDYPHYTRPAQFEGMQVPEVLLSGNHREIEKWRKSEALRRTRKLRPDLMHDRSGPVRSRPEVKEVSK